MASRKEYEMLFMLNAQMNGNFSGTFSKARSEFSRLGKEIQSLKSLQSDISSYQKQQGAIEATSAKLQNLQRQHDLLQKEIGETVGSTDALEREKLKLEQRINDTAASLDRQRQRLEATGARLKEAGIDTSNLAQKDAELTSKIKELREEQDKAGESADSFGQKSAAAFGAVQQAIAAAGITTALKEITEAYMECVGVAGDFEAAMSNVEALSGGTADEMSDLTAKAKELGATTKFTAQESADAMGYMAMAGWDAQEMLSGMDGVLQLAAASGEDLAMVSDIVTDNLSAFGLKASDTAHFSDVLAAAATNSNTNVSIMGETFKMSASVAGALGYTIEDVAVAVGLMANSGVKGSIAGTALKNTFNGLLEGVTLTSDAFGEYEYSAVKADGTMKSFGATIDELRVYFDQMTEAERVNNAMAIAGQRGYNGLLAILNATDEDYASLTESINNCSGAAAKMSAIKMDNLNGDLVLMNSAWDALKTTIGEQFIPEMRTLYRVGADVFGVMDSSIKKHPALVKGISAFIAVIGLATAGLTAYVTVTKVAIPLMQLFTASIPGVNIIMGVTAAVAGITAGIVALTSAANEGIPSVDELTQAAQEMREAMDEANAIYEDTVSSTMAAAGVADTYISKLEEMEAAGVNTEEEHRQYHNTLALLCQVVPELADYIDLETDTIEGGTAALRENTEAWKQNAIQQAMQDKMTELYQQYSDVLLETEKNEIGLARAQEELSDAGDKFNAVNKQAMKMLGATGELTDDMRESLAAASDEFMAAGYAVENYEKAIADDEKAVAAAKEEIALAEEAAENLTTAMQENSGETAEAAEQEQALRDAIDGTMEKVNNLSAAYQEAYDAAFGSISGQYQLWDEAAEIVANSVGTINSAMESQAAYWDSYNANLQSLADRSADIEGLREMIASFADGSADSVNAIAGMASASDEDLATMVENWKALQQAQSEVSGSIADLKADFTTQMDELQTALAEDIAAMDLGSEAAESGQATIQGYINGADSMLPQVQAAYARLAAEAQKALSPAGGSATFTVPGYAGGTQNAAPGFAVVGENGPELVYFNGGERVLTAAQTATTMSHRAVSANAYSTNTGGGLSPIQIVFQVDGNVSPETVDALREYGDEFAERVLEVIEQYGTDVMRRAYK